MGLIILFGVIYLIAILASYAVSPLVGIALTIIATLALCALQETDSL